MSEHGERVENYEAAIEKDPYTYQKAQRVMALADAEIAAAVAKVERQRDVAQSNRDYQLDRAVKAERERDYWYQRSATCGALQEEAIALRAELAEARREGHREGYETARGDLVSGASVGGPTYEALRDSYTGQRIAAESRAVVIRERDEARRWADDYFEQIQTLAARLRAVRAERDAAVAKLDKVERVRQELRTGGVRLRTVRLVLVELDAALADDTGGEAQ